MSDPSENLKTQLDQMNSQIIQLTGQAKMNADVNQSFESSG
jgi:hypothetical protein